MPTLLELYRAYGLLAIVIFTVLGTAASGIIPYHLLVISKHPGPSDILVALTVGLFTLFSFWTLMYIVYTAHKNSCRPDSEENTVNNSGSDSHATNEMEVGNINVPPSSGSEQFDEVAV